jgi:ParB-like chromosome segregation protein Spo0J
MIIVEKKITELKFAEHNARRLTKDQAKVLSESIKEFGFAQPITINCHPTRKNVIIGGHQRVIVAKKMKYKTLPCIEMSLTLEKERELNIRLNKNNGEWDPTLLQEHFDVKELLNWGFTKKELDFDITALTSKPAKRKKVRANVEIQFAIGEIRFTLPQEIYLKWLDMLVKQVGVKKEKQVDELKKRLKIDLKIK